ncbi:MAG: pantetheine-phosphate adenylyltransferase [Sphaerochaetaceae bacterium]|nr:pantetheine-phosphate adenylyltransferase [Sphaerochaetaceae bacterium]
MKDGKNRIAMFPGSFDPPTYGHFDIINRCAALYDKVYVVIGENIGKNSLFTSEEKKKLIEDNITNLQNVEVAIWSGLAVDFGKAYDVDVMIRGVRGQGDFSYEFEMAEINRELYPSLEVLFMVANPKFFLLRSSTLKEIAIYKGDISKMVPPSVGDALMKKLNGLTK